jgi:hypothetical protein
MTDWATEKALDIIAARKLTTKIVYDDNDTPFATIVADNSAVLIAEALREEREQHRTRFIALYDAGKLRVDTLAGVFTLSDEVTDLFLRGKLVEMLRTQLDGDEQQAGTAAVRELISDGEAAATIADETFRAILRKKLEKLP